MINKSLSFRNMENGDGFKMKFAGKSKGL